ncbi:sodium channel modifier 1-like isoform X1 [Dunckerocampus dactyliophorus]|uniref:sodium channel modifier 1-like isoform X1 n=1 Tax=Dunckerocampus dactyliophorus TaxID=161453 RepID=UPI00240772E1|nr:sodium channel modifier 1-like isoform X1 [Dunckerocampus dactyliophorus]XP_054636684.1 sodium channel modifier 1-like isoform X1 [Dunckerocampus dactyliophorus]XP_054636685.1 sodium channel modifier 1-like isoform X1 [Dunckerocampus dactyliophorus]
MSFKREGDDKSQLNILKKRRVANLLSNFIPEDEAALLSNGRYTCLVCSFRPVFDTVDMLTVHRKGKRHLEGLKAFYGKKAELKHEITKRKQENFIQAEDGKQEGSSSAPLLAQTRKLTHHALLKTVPYNSCHRRTSTKTEKGPASRASETRGTTCSKTSLEHLDPPKAGAESGEVLSSSRGSISGGCPVAAIPEPEPMTAQRRRELEHYLKLKSDGWLQDRSGNWIKDQNVEFDSDEEPPSLTTVPSSH